jgi:hypothetical protein
VRACVRGSVGVRACRMSWCPLESTLAMLLYVDAGVIGRARAQVTACC